MSGRRPGNPDWENFWPFDSGVMFGFCVYLRGPVLKGPFVDTLGFGVLTASLFAVAPCLNVVFFKLRGVLLRHFVSPSDEHNGMLPKKKLIGM